VGEGAAAVSEPLVLAACGRFARGSEPACISSERSQPLGGRVRNGRARVPGEHGWDAALAQARGEARGGGRGGGVGTARSRGLRPLRSRPEPARILSERSQPLGGRVRNGRARVPGEHGWDAALAQARGEALGGGRGGRVGTARSRGLRPLRSRLGTRLHLVRAVTAPRRPRQERSSSRAGRTRLGCSPRASARGSPWWRARRPCRNRSLSRLCLRDELAGIFIRADVLRVRGAHSKIARVATPGGRRRGRALRLRCKGFNGRDRAGRRTRSSLSPCGRQAG
jgi:hypothetical protein